jgi:hypothetical protein
MEVMNYEGVLTIMACGECHIPFAMPQAKYDKCLRDGDVFYCPNGHSRVFRDTEVKRLRKELERARESKEYFIKRNDELYAEKKTVERKYAAQKGQVTRIKNRVAKGVCPCCNRTFADLARHMESQHPDFTQNPAE